MSEINLTRVKITVCYHRWGHRKCNPSVLSVFYIRYNLSVKFSYRKSEQKTSWRYRVSYCESIAKLHSAFNSLRPQLAFREPIWSYIYRADPRKVLDTDSFFLHERKLLQLISSYTDFTAIKQQKCTILSDFSFKVTRVPDYTFLYSIIYFYIR